MTADEYMTKARRAIISAKLLINDGDIEGACNRAYYAMFDAAHAALLHSGAAVNPATSKTHNGLITAFGQYLVKPGHFSAELGKSLNQVERIRILSDYTGEEITEEKARWSVEQASAFVDAVQLWPGPGRK